MRRAIEWVLILVAFATLYLATDWVWQNYILRAPGS